VKLGLPGLSANQTKGNNNNDLQTDTDSVTCTYLAQQGDSSEIDPDLADIIRCWHELPERTKQDMLLIMWEGSGK